MAKSKSQPIGYLVAYEGELGPVPMGADADCEGAIESMTDGPVMFASRAHARRAIEISRLNALLRAQHGKSVNTDFTIDRKKLRIIPVFAASLPIESSVK